jgi:hypothetical protein
MLKALVLKELRETGWIAAVALVAHLSFVAMFAGYPVVPFWSGRNIEVVPFVDGSFLTTFCFVSVALAVALGLRQTAVESGRGTWLFLLHRPAGMRRVFLAKFAVGGGLYLLSGLIAILAYAAWAGLPGKHASPFFWWMTANAWIAWGVITIIYLAAFLAGIRPARWFGTRLLPLAGAGPLAMALVFVISLWPLLGIAALCLIVAYLVGLVLFTARNRDFS